MEFQNNNPIFLQIVDWICDKVLKGELQIGQQLPSVRDLAVQLEVNPNTVQRSIERLIAQDIVVTQRGKGNYLTADAFSRIEDFRRQRLLDEALPKLADEMMLLGVKPADVADALGNIISRRQQAITAPAQ
jgi:DNA-binding transcriptional regulator YhcF (GntR family)